ncbi:type II CAAX prenyl endopeptidase Rce1 family protein [Virgibacillus necropolis]
MRLHLYYLYLYIFLFGFIYKKTDSLWSVIIIHSMYDLLVSMFN